MIDSSVVDERCKSATMLINSSLIDSGQFQFWCHVTPTNIARVTFAPSPNHVPQKLVEDPSVNRIEDSYRPWNVVCTSPLLAHTQMILLNKCDIPDSKVRCEICIRDNLPSWRSG